MKTQEDLTGKIVQMSKRFARWNLDHPECYDSPSTDAGGEAIEDYDIDTQLFLMCLMGVPVTGIVKAKGFDSWGVLFMESGLSTFTYVDQKDLVVPHV